MKMAETVGFEPTAPFEGCSDVPGQCNQPGYATSPKVVGVAGFEPTVDDLLSPTRHSKCPTLPGYVNTPIEIYERSNR